MKVAILDDYHGMALQSADWSAIKARCDVTVFDRPLGVPDEAATALADFDILCTLRERMRIPEALIARLPKLKYIAVTGKRYDVVDVEAASRRGILVSNSEVPRTGGGVSELVWGLIHSVARNIPLEDRSMRQGGWQNTVGTLLHGKTLGVIGLGGIGGKVARYGVAFGMNVIAWSRSLTQDKATQYGAESVSWDELLTRSDVLTVHVPMRDSTRNLIGARELAAMKHGAYFINTSRGPIVNTDALVAALESGHLGGAGLDVYDVEPLPADHPLRRVRNTVLTPHLGYYTREALAVYYRDAVQAITAFLDGRPIRVVNQNMAATP